MKHIRSIYVFCSIAVSVQGWASKLPEERELTANFSNMSLRKVPADLTPTTTTLDLSYNLLSRLQSSDFRFVSKLKVLILRHNRIQELEVKTF